MKPKDKHVCTRCHKHRSVYQYRGRVRADRHHTLCFQCYRACSNQLRERARIILAGLCTLGKQPTPPYYTKPSAKAQRVQEQLEKYPDATVLDIEDALNKACQQSLIVESHRLVSVNAPDWLRIKQRAPKVFSPRPKFHKLD